MPPEETASRSEGETTGQLERRLWLDYLSRLIERELHARAGSGATSWVLAGILVAIVFKCVPRLQAFLNTPGAVRAGLVVLALEADIAVTILPPIAYLSGFPDPVSRLLPRSLRRVHRFLLWFPVALFAILTTLQVVTLSSPVPLAIRVILVSFGLVWAVFLLTSIRMGVKQTQAARVGGLADAWGGPFPFGVKGKLFIVLGSLAFCAAAVYAFLAFLRGAAVSGGWLRPLAGGSYCLAFLGIVIVLFFRVVTESHWTAYRALERDIVLEGLEAPQIKERFVDELLGKTVADQLRQKEVALGALEADILRQAESVRETLRRMRAAGPDTGHSAEDEKLVAGQWEELKAGLVRRYDTAMRSLMSEIKAYLGVRILPEDERSLLMGMLRAREGAADRAREVVEEVAALAEEGKSRVKPELAEPSQN